jgi:hypothetical protein
MKNFSVLLALLFTTLTGFAQNFEGKIEFANTYKTLTPNVPESQWEMMMGSKMDYYIKNGFYKTITNGKLMKWQVYNQKENKLYTKLSSTEKIMWNDGAENTDQVIKAEINKGVKEIMGFLCDELVLTCKSGTQKYYFHPAFSVDPAHFAQHKYSNWNEFISRSRALPLKMIIQNPNFIMESTAISYSKEKVSQKIFELPSGAMLEKSKN